MPSHKHPPSSESSSESSSGSANPDEVFKAFLEPFAAHTQIQKRVLIVLKAMPAEVTSDFLQDPRFRIAMDDFAPGRGRKVWMPSPDQTRSRCVVLKPKLSDCSEQYACYIIAHELAHAFLHNGGWGDIDDPEEAADALAEHWGFGCPAPRR